MTLVEYNVATDTHVPLAEPTQAADGALVTMASDGSALLRRILAEKLTEMNLMSRNDPGGVYAW